jgi:hypothetical protein
MIFYETVLFEIEKEEKKLHRQIEVRRYKAKSVAKVNIVREVERHSFSFRSESTHFFWIFYSEFLRFCLRNNTQTRVWDNVDRSI